MLKHGHRQNRSRTYVSWMQMKQRCKNPHHKFFYAYGGRGIKVCRRWEKFQNFLTDMGERPPGMTLDRERVNANYGPRNCRWADAITQRRNQRRCS